MNRTNAGSDMSSMPLSELVDLERYPIDRPESEGYRALVEEVRRKLHLEKAVQLHGFARPEASEAMHEAVRARIDLCDGRTSSCNVFFSPDDPDLPDDHPVRIFQPVRGRSLCRDHMGEETPMVQLFEADSLLGFVRDVMSKKVLYRHADPMNSVMVLISGDGESGLWHFDGNEVSVTLLVQKPQGGGKFEYVPDLRSDGEQNFEGAGAVLRGCRDAVVTTEAEPGTLQIFCGRHSLHHVSTVEGPVDRYVLVFGYADRPGMQSSKGAMLELQGRCHPLHEEDTGRISL